MSDLLKEAIADAKDIIAINFLLNLKEFGKVKKNK